MRSHLRSSGPRLRPITAIVVGALTLAPLLLPGVARGHGDIRSAKPEQGSTVDSAPDHLIIEFTEAPTKQSVIKVTDGCGDNVVDQAAFDDGKAHVFLTDAQPGKWKVSYQVVSAVDGHPSKDSYTLTVTGKADCSAPKDEPKDSASNGGSGPGPQAEGDPGDTDEGSFPVVPVALGTVGLLAVAVVVRRLSG